MCELELKNLAFETVLNEWAEAHKQIAKKIKKKEPIYKKEWDKLKETEKRLEEIRKMIDLDLSKIYDSITINKGKVFYF